MHPYAFIEDKLKGWPGVALTWALVGLGLAFIVIGLTVKSNTFKAAALTYGILP